MDLLIFDFDGLILDTETVIFEAWNEIFQSYGRSLPLSEWAACIGTSHQAFDVFGYLEARLGRPLSTERNWPNAITAASWKGLKPWNPARGSSNT